MDIIKIFDFNQWHAKENSCISKQVTDALEHGHVISLAQLEFTLLPEEKKFFPLSGQIKNLKIFH